MNIKIYKDEQELLDNFKQIIENIANESIAVRDKFCIGLSGEEFFLFFVNLAIEIGY